MTYCSRELCKVRKLPPAAYSEEEWRTVRSIFIVLRHAIAQLRVVFAEQDVIDFAEAGIAAHAALENPSVLMRLDERVQHLLVDEFQDTSRPHFGLLRALLDDWQPGDGRTCFFVGDPMQSIYLFRDAESRLFSQVREHGMEMPGRVSAADAAAALHELPLRSPRSCIRSMKSSSACSATIPRTTCNMPPRFRAKAVRSTAADAMHLHVQTFEKARGPWMS